MGEKVYRGRWGQFQPLVVTIWSPSGCVNNKSISKSANALMLSRRKCFNFAAKQIHTKDPVHNITIWETFLQKDSQEKKELETKLRNLNFTKGASINLFQNTSRNTVKELYQLQGNNNNAVDAIAIYHVITSLSKNVNPKQKSYNQKETKV